jgi:hypothetical protein
MSTTSLHPQGFSHTGKATSKNLIRKKELCWKWNPTLILYSDLLINAFHKKLRLVEMFLVYV